MGKSLTLFTHTLCFCQSDLLKRLFYLFYFLFFFLAAVWGKKEMKKQHDQFFIYLFSEPLRRMSKRCASGSAYMLILTL